MITYCLGDIKAKRAAFRAAEADKGQLSIDNDEILTTVEKEGKTFFAVGEVPYADMSVAEFVAYSKSLIKAQPVRDRETAYYARLFGFKLSVKRRLKSLDVPKYRMAQFLAKYDLSVRDVFINFDGYEYSRRHRKSIERFVKKLKRYFNVFIAVSDYRFSPEGGAVRRYAADGTVSEINLKAFLSSRGRKRAFKTLLKEKDLSIGDFDLRKVVVSSI